MNTYIRFITVGILMLCTNVASAYEISTHGKFSEEAYDQSELNKDTQLLQGLGLKNSDTFPNSVNPRPRTIKELISDGSRFEDNLFLGSPLRVRHHFYDPLYDRPLTVLGLPAGEKSPDWALEDSATVSTQDYSLRDTREYLYRALTLSDRDERDKNFGKTFETLGHVIHHLQDMAQPQHVRNDVHPNVGSHKSLYESHTDLPKVRDELPYTSYGPVTFDQARKFWHTETAFNSASGRGLAEFTNQNFLSAGTNFQLHADGTVALNARYPNPASTGPSQTVPIQTLLQEDGACQVGGGGDCGNECGPPVELPPACGLVGEVVFYGSIVWDNYAGGSALNERASTLSLFDQDLEQYNATVTYTDEDDPFSATIEYQRLFTLNRFNFQYAYPHLIPKAVAYSAGLIDFFFRGRIEVLDVSDDDSQLTIEIRNVSGTGNDFKNGKFELYYDAMDGTRQAHTLTQNATADLAVDARLVLTAEKLKLSQVDLSKENPLTLVYRGQIGKEEGIAAAVPEMPLSGFVVSPSPPAPGNAGNHIYFEDGVWRVSPYTGLEAGDIDWKGTVNGRRKVLSWWGGKGRNIPDWTTKDGVKRSPYIYQNGRIFAVAPASVLGAALTRDSQGKTWLLAIVAEREGDVVYKRPAKRSDSPEKHDPVSMPDGWMRLGAFPRDSQFGDPDRPWFFNASGTQAQTMRLAGKTLAQTVNGVTTESKVTGLDRLYIEINDAVSVRTENRGNLGGYQGNMQCDVTSSGDDSSARMRGNTTGEYILAVDYRGDQEVLAKLSYSGTGTRDTNAKGLDNANSFSIENVTESLTIGTTTYKIFEQSSEGWQDLKTTSRGRSYREESNLNYTVWRMFTMDLRHDLIAYYSQNIAETDTVVGNDIVDTMTVSSRTNDTEHVHMGNATELEAFNNSDSYSGQYSLPPSNRIRGCVLDWGGLPILSSSTTSLPYSTSNGFAYNPMQGAWIVDTEGRIFISQTKGSLQYVVPQDTFFNYFTGGIPASLVSSPADKQHFVPVGLIR